MSGLTDIGSSLKLEKTAFVKQVVFYLEMASLSLSFLDF